MEKVIDFSVTNYSVKVMGITYCYYLSNEIEKYLHYFYQNALFL